VQRIVSLVPSQTELLFHLGLNEEVIGITKFCVHPAEWFKSKTKIGGTKNINIQKIQSLKPDLVIANKEENTKEQIETLKQFTELYVSDVKNYADALKMITHIGKLVRKEYDADKLIKEIDKKMSALTITHQPLSTAYLIWKDPYMAAGGDTFIHDMMQRCGLKNVFADALRYPEIIIEQLKSRDCKVLLLSSEPYPFKQKHIDELQPQLLNTKIILADGEMFSWYGSRLLFAADYFQELIRSFA
jgi:ABC-type Fe3+-hydroxamate transport system substrate-binding protein